MAPADPRRESETGSAELFHTTHWSVVLLAGQDASPLATEALEMLCRTYWYPLYAYIRRKGHDADEAQDLTQEFLVRLVEKNYLAHANRAKGKFRSFLLAALNHFLASEWHRAQAAKRGGGQAFISLDDDAAEGRYALEPVSELTPERIYERRWALTLLELALEKLRAELAKAGKASRYEQLSAFLTSPGSETAYATAGAALGMTSGAVATAVHRLRQRYRELLCSEISKTVASPGEVEEEVRWLFAAVG